MNHSHFHYKPCFLLGVFILATIPLVSQLTNVTVADARKYVQNLAIKASADQIAVQNEIKVLDETIKQEELNLKSAKDKNDKTRLSQEIKRNKIKLTNAKSELKNKISTSKKYKNLLLLNDANLIASLKKQNILPTLTDGISSQNRNAVETDNNIEIKHDVSVPQPPKQLIKNETSPAKTPPAYRSSDHAGDCTFQLVADKKKTALEPEILFTYTPDELKKHLKGIPYSKGWANISREPGYLFLQLTMEIASEQALEYYGNLNKSFMTIKLVNGKEVRLINSGYDNGQIDRYKKASIISGIFNIDKPTEKILMSAEVDTIKLNLISGFENYTIYNVDFFTRQLNCINSVK